jgi:hypothetical protein
MDNRASYIYNNNLKRRIFYAFKSQTINEKNNIYEQKLKQKTEQGIKTHELSMKQQLEDLMELIMKAEDRLKHENRKKVQTKLMLDQIVLKGISALNIQALGLSQNTLTGIEC